MRNAIPLFYEFLQQPLYFRSRFALAALVLPLVLTFTAPLWSMYMHAPQYPNGLTLHIFPHTIEGGRDGADLKEINILNHYIGMHHLDRAEFADLDWIPFAIGVIAVLTLRVAVIGNVSALIDLLVIVGYFSVFSLARFAFMMYTYGHNLSPEAPIHVDPFTPPVLGSLTIANFTVASWPNWGTVFIGTYATGVLALAAYHLWRGRRDAKRKNAAA